MKRITRVIFVFFCAVLMSVAVLTIAVRAFLTPDRIKAYLIPEAEKALNRQLLLGDVSIGVFSGIRVKDLSIKDTDGRADFLKCRELVLKYKLLPLLKKQIIVDELRLSGPEITLSRSGSGRFNYEGIGKGAAGSEKSAEQHGPAFAKAGHLPVSLLIDRIEVDNAGISFSDSMKEIPEAKGRFSADMSLHLARGLSESPEVAESPVQGLKMKGRIKLSELSVSRGKTGIIFSGDITFIDQSVSIDLKSNAGRHTARITGTAGNILDAPSLKMNLEAKEFDLDEVLTAFALGKEAAPPAKAESKVDAREKADHAGKKSAESKITVSGQVRIDKAAYKTLTMTGFRLAYEFRKNWLEITEMTASTGKGTVSLKAGFDFSRPVISYAASGRAENLHADEVAKAFFPSASDSVSGLLSTKFSLEGAGITSDAVKRSLLAEGDFSVQNGKITNSKLADGLAFLLGINEFRTIHMKQGKGTVRVSNGVARLESLFTSDDFSMNPSGDIGLDETLNLAFDLKLSPRLTAAVTRSQGVTSYIRDEKGWGSIPLRVTGTFSNPSYGVDISKAGKRFIEKKGEELLKKLFR